MSRTLTVECPTGLVVTLREFKVRDEDLLANPKAIRKGIATTDLLKAITVGVDEPGPYPFRDPKRDEEGPQLSWGRILQGDRMTVLLKNRIYTWGPDLEYPQPCQNCNQPTKKELDLEELPIKTLPESSLKHVRDGIALEPVTLPGCGVKVGFRLLRGEDDRGLQKIQKTKKDRRSSAYHRFRIVSIDGIPQPNWLDWIENMGGMDSSFLRAAYDEADCGVDQETEFECDACDHVWMDELRFRADFLFPRYKRRKSKTAT